MLRGSAVSRRRPTRRLPPRLPRGLTAAVGRIWLRPWCRAV